MREPCGSPSPGSSRLWGLSSNGTENPHKHRIVSENMHIADEHGGIRCETRRKIPPFATEFCDSKKPANSGRRPVSGNSRVLRNRHVPRLLTEEQEPRVVTGTEPGQTAPAVMWVFCSVADTVGEFGQTWRGHPPP